MKKLLLMIAIIFQQLISYSQAIIPASNLFKHFNKISTQESIKEQISLLNYIDSSLRYIDKLKDTIMNKDVLKTQIISSKNMVLTKYTIQDTLSYLNQLPRFLPILSAGIGGVENFKEAFGNAQIGVSYRLTDFKISKNKKWIDPHYVYAMFGVRTHTSKDTESFIKTLIFHELTKRDFVLGYFCDNIRNNFTVSPTVEYSISSYLDSNSGKRFVSNSLLVGTKFRYDVSFDNKNSFISIFPYFNIIDIDPKYNSTFKQLTKEEKIANTIKSLGLQTSVQFEKGILFCNMKYVYNNGKVDNPDLFRFVYTIGTTIAL